nr:uncharacterized protein LOC102586962 [Ipomoea trifida]GMD06242.1 trihelix transcription factor ASR3-like [Ipomoea batatas]GMD09543.1 trihelix transcription factor ASR3-like [Ipomoea batatas]
MRDFKKVREYERRVSGDDNKSYWKLERNERKENNLPTNMLREIYEALVEVVDRKGQRVVMCDSSDPDTSEHSDSPAKRRRMGEGTSGTQTSGGGNMNSHQEVGPAISRSAALIAEAIQSSEEREERRHRELLSLHERRLQIEESKAEINRQGINGLVDAINRLANSILTLATNNNQPGPPPS